MASVKDTINTKIAGKKVMMFSKSYCPFCTKAKKVFDKYLKSGELKAEDYEVLELDNIPNGDDYQNCLQEITGGRSVPRVFISGKFIGGGDDVVAKDSSGALKTML